MAALPSGWEQDILQGINAPVNSGNIAFLDSWKATENTAATDNPFATTQTAPGSTPLSGNPAGVQNYPDWQTGLQATDQTLLNGHYPDLLSLIRGGTIKPGDTVTADLSTWGTGAVTVGTGSGTATPAAAPSGLPTSGTASAAGIGKNLALWFLIAVALIVVMGR